MSDRNRIKPTDSVVDAMVKLCEGNPRAVTVCLRCYQEGDQIDPQAILGGFYPLLILDGLGIYGSRIWMLYKDVCGQDIIRMLALLRGRQLGLVDEATLQHAIDNRGEGLDVPAVLAEVQARLPYFGQAPAADTGAEVPAPPMDGRRNGAAVA